MSTHDFIWIGAIVGALFVVREIVFQYSTHKLLNKLMSRNYHEFQISQKASKIDSTGVIKVREDDGELAEDLSAIGL